MKLKYNIQFQKVGRTYVGVAVGEDSRLFTGKLLLNAVGCELVRLLQEETSAEAMTEWLLQQYDIEPELARKSVQDIVDHLESLHLLVS